MTYGIRTGASIDCDVRCETKVTQARLRSNMRKSLEANEMR
jgi:hypothetical protein